MYYGKAYLGECIEECSVPIAKSNDQPDSKLKNLSAAQHDLKAFPNPFINKISFSFRLTESGPVNLQLYDMNGKLVATIFNGVIQKGMMQKVNFDGGKLPAGIYIGRLQTASGTTEQRIVRSR